jgi:protein gp37
LSKRNPAVLGQWGKGKPRVLAKNWNDPVKWNRREIPSCMCDVKPPERCGCYSAPTVFPSLCDWLDDEVPIEWLARFLKLIHDTPNLNWLLLSKRPENWRNRLANAALEAERLGVDPFVDNWLYHDLPPKNVWIGTSVEDQPNADRRIPALLKIPAIGRFLSLEPLLGAVDLSKGLYVGEEGGPEWVGALRQMINWLIIGGESGHGARPCNVEWIRSLIAQGKVAGCSTFVKQLGARPEGPKYKLRENGEPNFGRLDWGVMGHPKGGDPAEWPADLRVREFPEGLR